MYVYATKYFSTSCSSSNPCPRYPSSMKRAHNMRTTWKDSALPVPQRTSQNRLCLSPILLSQGKSDPHFIDDYVRCGWHGQTPLEFPIYINLLWWIQKPPREPCDTKQLCAKYNWGFAWRVFACNAVSTDLSYVQLYTYRKCWICQRKVSEN